MIIIIITKPIISVELMWDHLNVEKNVLNTSLENSLTSQTY